MIPEPPTAGELLAILAVLLVRLGKTHPLTQRVQALYDHTDRPAGANHTEGDSQ